MSSLLKVQENSPSRYRNLYLFFSRMSTNVVYFIFIAALLPSIRAKCSESDAFISKYVKWQMSTMETSCQDHRGITISGTQEKPWSCLILRKWSYSTEMRI